MNKKPVILFLLIFTVLFAEAQLNINHYIRVGRTRISIGNYTGAIEYFNIVVKFKPYLPEAYFYRGVAKHQLEDYRGAIIDYDRAIEIKPFYPQAYMNRGMAYHNLGEFEKAIEDYNKGLDYDPENESIYNNRGIAKLALKDIKGAIEDYNKVLEINPKSTHALMNRSNAHIVEGDVLEAIRDLNQVIIIRPHFGAAYLNRGLARFELDDYASALRDYDQSIRLEPDNALAYNNRGIVKHKLGDYEGAIMDYDIALRQNPEMASAYFNRAMAREILGRPGFQDDYRLAAQLNPQFDLSRRMIDAEQLAQNQQSQSQQQQQQQSSQAQPGAKQNTASAADTDDDKEAEEDTKEETEKRRGRRQSLNLIVEDSRNLPSDEEYDPDDGRVQNHNIVIDLQPVFIVSAFEKNTVDYERSRYYNIAIDELNKLNNYNPTLTITNKSVTEYLPVFENFVLYFNERINIERSSHNFLNRGIFFSLTGSFNAALEDLNRSIETESRQAITYFTRANTRYKMLEQIELVNSTPDELSVQVGSISAPEENITLAMPEYQKIMDDYQTVLELNPQFFFGYFNLAYIKLRLSEYENAIEDLDRAIELEPEFAEAYFNRGLTKIYLDDIEGAAIDLSRAGELGINGAYNIIKRYCN